ncbi:hypothetical protein DIZ27_08905 [Streptomyces sp. NWU339]|uniref:hypothetical protein n=1 Tax=Streptomyces sp. NWU339 TaxID=2185284 RepID=UPI000D681DE2|nr:hypothetical protein [Streptomyces sp. NWU339]PWI10968.1 hypothetical protein DIZ27_08905 [Streptomyces sp. NWU339]
MRGWKGSIRQLTAGMGALAAALALMLWGASPASAGGPTSVLVVSPGSGETASLYNSDKAYGMLEQLLGPVGKGTRDMPPEAASASARLINVTWMVHDVTPWRVDRVFLADMGQDVWIHTAGNLAESPNGLWHRAEHPSDVHKFLFDLGVMGKTTGTGSAPDNYPAPWQTEQAGAGTEQAGPGADQDATAAASETRAAPATDDGTDWWWAIPGLAAGAALALVLRPYVTRLPLIRRREDREDPGPRQELLDA